MDAITVTGGAGTLALVSARALLDHGLSNLALFDLPSSFRVPAFKDTLSILRMEFPNAVVVGYEVDVTDEKAVKQATEDVVEDLGGVDILCCFAGVVGCQHADQMQVEEWRRVLDINTTGAFICAQAAARYTCSPSLFLIMDPPTKRKSI